MLLFSTIFLIAGLLILRWLHTQYQLNILVEPAQAPKNAPLISLCVPARNEERNIEACVNALLAQTYPNFEIIILDDRSIDSTPQILSRLEETDSRLSVIHGADLPYGWAGKPHALLQASAAARGEWLCFVDADTFLEADALSSVYAKALETKADLFTMMTRQIMLTFWERTVLPLVMTALSVGFSPHKVNDPERKDAIANGQFIFIKRIVYDAIGGHGAVHDSIVEDKDLAHVVKGAGYRLVIADGQRMASTRMYTSLPEMWEGWTKNIYLGLREERALMILGVFGAILAFAAAVALPLWLMAGVYLTVANPGYGSVAILVESILLWGYLIYWRVLASRGMGIPSWYALTTPLGAAVFGAMMLTSAFNVISGKGVVWKGRRYNR